MSLTSSAFMSLTVSEKQVESLLWALDTALNPFAIAGFLGAEVDPYIRTRARQRFRDEGDDVSGKWAPLAEATWTWRTGQGYQAQHPINKRSGELEGWVTESAHRMNVHTLGATLTMPGNRGGGELTTKVKTAQIGKPDPNTPPRPVIGMNEKDLSAVLSLLFLYIEKSSRRRKP